MKPFTLYRHVNNTDVAILPLRITPIIKGGVLDRIKVRFDWYNIVNPNNRFSLDAKETIEIKAEDIKNWKELRYD